MTNKSTTNQSTFAGPHLWINHDGDHRQARLNRRRVFSHIQNQNRPWQHREKSLRNRAGFPKDDDEDPPESPKSVLFKGNSDPFEVFPVKIGPEENELVLFYRDVILPVQYKLRFPLPQLAQLRTQDWEDCIGGLIDEGIAHALLARWGQMVSLCTPAMRKAAIEHRYWGTQLLSEDPRRRRLANLQRLSDYQPLLLGGYTQS